MVLEISARAKQDMDNRRTAVRQFLEERDILEITEIYREHMPILTRDDMIETICKLPQLSIDQIYRAEALDEATQGEDNQAENDSFDRQRG